MPEPLAVLSVASAIVQFVDFSSKLLVAGYGAYKSNDGTTDDNAQVSRVYTDLKSVAERLAQLPGHSTLKQSADEIALYDLAQDCKRLADRLVLILSRLEVTGQGLPRAWNALRITIRKVLKASELEKLQKALADIRSELGIRMLSIIR